jgi:hypothetical protein
LDRITIFRPEGGVYEVHTVPHKDCPYLYASKLVNRHRREGQDFSYQVEISGKKSKPYSADEIQVHAFLKEVFGAPKP